MAHNQSQRALRDAVLASPLAHYLRCTLVLSCSQCRDRRELRIEPHVSDGRGAQTVEQFLIRLRCRQCGSLPATVKLQRHLGQSSPGREITLVGLMVDPWSATYPLPPPSVPGPPVTWTFAPTLDFSNPGNLGQGPRGDLRDYHRGWVGVFVRGGLSRSRQPPALGQRRPAFCCTVLGANARRRIIPALVIATAIYQREIATLHDVPKRNSGFL